MSMESTKDQIVLGLDLNKNAIRAVFTNKLNSMYTNMVNLGKHTTYIRGSNPNDGLYVSPSLYQSNCGFLMLIADMDWYT